MPHKTREARNAYLREHRRKPPPGPDTKETNPSDPRVPPGHGSPKRYERLGCRCELCKLAKADKAALSRARVKARREGVELDEEAWWQQRVVQ